jgi:hypothetical protein
VPRLTGSIEWICRSNSGFSSLFVVGVTEPSSLRHGSGPETGLREAPKSVSKMPTQVNSPWPNPQLLIALHSPNALQETGLRMCLPEKSQDSTAFDAEQSVLRSPVWLGIIAKYGQLSRILAQSERNFSAVQTAWRRERDSNPRYPFGYSGFQDRLFQPLTHPSARGLSIDAIWDSLQQSLPQFLQQSWREWASSPLPSSH